MSGESYFSLPGHVPVISTAVGYFYCIVLCVDSEISIIMGIAQSRVFYVKKRKVSFK